MFLQRFFINLSKKRCEIFFLINLSIKNIFAPFFINFFKKTLQNVFLVNSSIKRFSHRFLLIYYFLIKYLLNFLLSVNRFSKTQN
jgi:hypothetical protein